MKPAGGVTEGQKLVVPFTPGATSGGTGKWNDDIFACTRYGICHPSLICALCCRFVLIGQIMTRLKLDWLANPAPAGEWSKTFKTLVYITVAYIVLAILFAPSDPEDDQSSFSQLINFCFAIFLWFLLTKVRKIVRQRQNIPEKNCIGCEDFCCAFWCGCCTIAQLARQTTDYDEEEARFLTSDGLSPKTPVVIV